VTRVAVGSTPLAVSYDRHNDKVYCANSGSASVTVIDGRSDTALTTIAVGAKPTALEWNGAYNRTYVANSGGGSVSVLRDSAPSTVGETMNDERGTANAGPTVVRGMLSLEVDSRRVAAYRAELLDISGRRAATLKPGENDVSRLAPGVYFVRQASCVMRSASSVTKVVLTR